MKSFNLLALAAVILFPGCAAPPPPVVVERHHYYRAQSTKASPSVSSESASSFRAVEKAD